MKTKRIEAYSFHEFLQSYQEAVLEGFRLDIETNEHFPQKFGDYLAVVLVDAESQVEPAVEPAVKTRKKAS